MRSILRSWQRFWVVCDRVWNLAAFNRRQRRGFEQRVRRKRRHARRCPVEILQPRAMLDANPLIAIAATAPTTQEGTSAAQFTLTRTGDLSESFDVNIGVSGTASSADYANLTLPVHFGSGESQQTISVSAFDDHTHESDETVSLTVLSGTGYDVDPYAADATVTIQDAPNQDPTANEDVYEVAAERGADSATIDWSQYAPNLGNDTDPDNDSLTLISGPFSGSETVAVGSVASKQYMISDGYGGTATGTVTVRVVDGPFNNPPVANDDIMATVTAERGATGAYVNWSQYAPDLGNDYDVDGDVPVLTSGPLSGNDWVAIGSSATRQYTISDGHGGTATGNVIVNVVADTSNTPPIANADTYVVTAERGATGATVNWSLFAPDLGNDSDPENDPFWLTSGTFSGTETVAVGASVSRSYTITDSYGASSTGIVTVNVVQGPLNTPPVANEDVYELPAERGATSAVVDWSLYAPSTGNDTDFDNDPLTIDAGSFNNAGTETVAVGSSVSRTYTINDGYGGTATGTVTVRVVQGPINNPPTAGTDTHTVTAERGATSAVVDWSQYAPDLSNDSDPDGDTPTLDAGSFNGTGTETVAVGSSVSRTYTINDGHGGTATGTVTVNVVQGPLNNPPVANEDVYELPAERGANSAVVDWSLYGPSTGNDTDLDYDPLSIESGSFNNAGTETVAVGSSTSRTYTINDGHGGTATGTVTVRVVQGPLNTPPVANEDVYELPAERGATSAVVDWSQYAPSTGNDTDLDYDPLTIESGSFNNAGTETVAVGSSVSRTYTINDGHGGTATGTVTVRVVQGPFNNPPVAVDDLVATLTAPRGASGMYVDWSQYAPNLGNDYDLDGDVPTLTSGSFNGSDWVAVGASTTRQYTISDGHGGTANGTVTINVVADTSNTPPIPNEDVYDLPAERGATSAIVDWSQYAPNTGNDNDPDGDPFWLTSGPFSGTETVGVGASASRSYTITDSYGASSTGTVTVRVVQGPLNTPPVANEDVYELPAERGATSAVVDWSQYAPSTGNDTDFDNDPLTIDAGSFNNAGTEAVAVGSSTSRTYTINDGHGGTATGTVTVRVVQGPFNNPPTAGTDTYTVTAERGKDTATVNWSLYTPNLTNDSDLDYDSLTLEGTWAGDSQEVTVGQTVSRTYTINDGHGGTATGTVEVTVAQGPINQNPTAVNDEFSLSILQPLTIGAPGVLANDTDPESDPLTIYSYTQPTHGTVTVDPNGGFVYTPTGGWIETGDEFTYTVRDNLGGQSAAATVKIRYEFPAVAADDSYNAWSGEPLMINAADGVLANDRGAYDGTKQIVEFPSTRTAHGTVTMDAYGAFTYTSDENYYGLDSFQYRLAGGGAKDTGYVTINVHRRSHADNSSYTTLADTNLSGTLASAITPGDDGYASIRILSEPQHGTIVSFNPETGDFEYKPNDGYEGTDSFTFDLLNDDGSACGTANQATASINVVPIRLTEIEFVRDAQGSQLSQVYNDTGSVNYNLWADSNDDGTNDPDDHHSPLVYTLGSTQWAKPTLVLILTTPAPNEIWIRGDGTGMSRTCEEFTTSFSGKLTLTRSDTANNKYYYSTVSPLEGSKQFGDQAQVYDNFTISWSVSLDGTKWSDKTLESDNQVYIARTNDFADIAKVWHTAIEFGAQAAQGFGVGTAFDLEISNRLIDKFSSLSLRGYTNGKPLTYYAGNVDGPDVGMAGLLGGNGNCSTCGTWAKFFGTILSYQNVKSYNTDLKPRRGVGENVGDSLGMIIKQWNFSNTPSRTDADGYSYVFYSKTKDFNIYAPKFFKGDGTGNVLGVAAQGNDDPPPLFAEHQIVAVKYTDESGTAAVKYFDPSYGVSYDSIAQFISNSLAGTYRLSTEKLDESNFAEDLNGNGNQTDPMVDCPVFRMRKADANTQIEPTISDVEFRNDLGDYPQ